MEHELMLYEIDKYCNKTYKSDDTCEKCKIKRVCDEVDGVFDEHEDRCVEAYNIIKSLDSVDHPKHYCRDGAMECIDEMCLIFGTEAVKNFCLCNSWKYRYRAADKNGEEDLEKSDWYIHKYKELCDEEMDYI